MFAGLGAQNNFFLFFYVSFIEIKVSQLLNKTGFSVSLVQGDRLYSAEGDLF